MPDNLFDDLGTALKAVRIHLDSEIAVIQPAIGALRSIVPDQVDGLLTGLAEMLHALSAELQQLQTGGIPGLGETAEFSRRVRTLLGAANPLLSHLSDDLDVLGEHADVIAGLPMLDALKPQLLDDISAIEAHVASLQP